MYKIIKRTIPPPPLPCHTVIKKRSAYTHADKTRTCTCVLTDEQNEVYPIIFGFVLFQSTVLFCGGGLGFQGLVRMSEERQTNLPSVTASVAVSYCVEILVGKFTETINNTFELFFLYLPLSLSLCGFNESGTECFKCLVHVILIC